MVAVGPGKESSAFSERHGCGSEGKYDRNNHGMNNGNSFSPNEDSRQHILPHSSTNKTPSNRQSNDMDAFGPGKESSAFSARHGCGSEGKYDRNNHGMNNGNSFSPNENSRQHILPHSSTNKSPSNGQSNDMDAFGPGKESSAFSERHGCGSKRQYDHNKHGMKNGTSFSPIENSRQHILPHSSTNDKSSTKNIPHKASDIIDLSVDQPASPMRFERDDDDDLFAPLNGYDSSDNPRVDKHQPNINHWFTESPKIPIKNQREGHDECNKSLAAKKSEVTGMICSDSTTTTTGTVTNNDDYDGDRMLCNGTNKDNEHNGSKSSRVPPYTGNNVYMYEMTCNVRGEKPDQDRITEITEHNRLAYKRNYDLTSSDSSSDSSSLDSDSSSLSESEAISIIQPSSNVSNKVPNKDKAVKELIETKKKEDTRTKSKIRRDDRRKIKQRHNRKKKSPWKDAMKNHCNIIKENELYNDKGKIDGIDPHTSYSMIQSLSKGFSIVMYSGTHHYGINTVEMHRDMGIRLVLGRDMTLIWHERVYYSCGRTRYKAKGKGIGGYHYSVSDANMSPSRRDHFTQSEGINPRLSKRERIRHRKKPKYLPCQLNRDNVPPLVPMYDPRLFCHLLNEPLNEPNNGPCIEKSVCSQTIKSSDFLCKDFLNFDPTLERSHTDQGIDCKRCRQDATILDLSTVSHLAYRCGDTIVGDLNAYGWVVVRSPKVEEHTEHEILRIGTKCGKLSLLEPRKTMNYYDKTKTKYTEQWKSPSIDRFLLEMKESVIDRNLPTKSYIVGRKTLLENMNVITKDQKPQSDL